MKKTVLLLLVVSMLICVFAACGKEAATEQVSVSESFVAPETPEPTEEPEEETAEEEAPADATPSPSPSPSPSPKAEEKSTDSGNSGSTNSSANSNSNSQSTTTQSESTPAEETESVDPLTAAQGCIGASVSTLKSAIGEPNSSNYVASCLQPDTEDGYLSYDGFTVATVRYADGTEVVSDVY